MRGLHGAMGALAALQRAALEGGCGISSCGVTSVGFIQGISNRPVGVCERHAAAARTRGWTVHTEPISRAASQREESEECR